MLWVRAPRKFCSLCGCLQMTLPGTSLALWVALLLWRGTSRQRNLWVSSVISKGLLGNCWFMLQARVWCNLPRSKCSEVACHVALLSLSVRFSGGLPGYCCHTPASKANRRCWKWVVYWVDWRNRLVNAVAEKFPCVSLTECQKAVSAEVYSCLSGTEYRRVRLLWVCNCLSGNMTLLPVITSPRFRLQVWMSTI